jgi:hypothetical protein
LIGRIVAPPAFPVQVRPGTADGSEHIPPEYPGADLPEPARGEIIVNTGRAAFLAEQGALERACRNKPLVQILCAYAKWMVYILIRTCSVSV